MSIFLVDVIPQFEYSELIVCWLYFLPIALAFLRLHRRQIAYVTSLSVILLALDLPLSPIGAIPWQIAVFNRTLEASILSLVTFVYVHFKKMNEAQRESEDKYRGIVENSPSFIGILQDGMLKYVNRAAVTRLGWTYDELVSPSFNPIEKAVAERFRGLIKENIGKRLRGGGEDAPPYEISVIMRDGSEIPVIVQAARITYQGRPAVEFVFGDITERKQMENRLNSLHEHSLRLASATTIEQIAEYTLHAMEGALGFSIAGFSLVEKGRIQIIGSRGMGISLPELPLNGPGIMVKAANTRMPVMVPDTRKEAAYVDFEGRTGAEANYVNLSELAVPVLVDGEPATVLNVESHTLNAFSEKDQQLLEMLALHVSSAQGRLKHDEELNALARFPLENPSPVLRVSRDGALLYANMASNKLLQLWGTKVGGPIPKFWQDLIDEAVATGLSSTTDLVLDERAYAMYIVPVTDAGYVNLYGRDITERRKWEETLKKSEERFRQAMEATNDGLWDWNVETDEMYLSPAYNRMLGYEPGKLPDHIQSWKDLVHPDDRERTLWTNENCIENKVPNFEVEFRMRSKSGEWKWILGRGMATARSTNGRAVRMIGTHVDISERKRMEEQIKLLREQEYNTLLQATMDGFWRLDTSGRFLDVNDAYSRMIGYSRDELLKMQIQDVEAKENAEETAQRIRKVMEVGSERFETRHRRKDGKLIDIDVSAKHLETDGEQFFVFLRDITERKRLEERLSQAKRLAAIGETAAMVGHDLRNPLQGIAGAIHLLKQESLTANERNEMLQLIQNNIEYSDAIVRDLSEYSAEINLKLADTTPKSLTTEAIKAMKVPPTVTVQDLSQNHPTIKVDKDRIKRVLVNLIENAIDAMPQGGTLTISSRLGNDTVEITLSDTGPGMPEKIIENLWKPLQTTKAKGMGFGLPICKRIVDAHGGTISVKSKTGEGTTITIGLPIKPLGVEVKQK